MAKFELVRHNEGYDKLTTEQLISIWKEYQRDIESVEKEISDYKSTHKWERTNPARTKFMREKYSKIDSLRYPQEIIEEELQERGISLDVISK